jgi:muramoyltetrapeptide carboxypeptidase
MAAYKPRRLKRGDTVGVVATAGCVDVEPLERGLEAIRQAGFRVAISPGVYDRKGYLAGEEAARARAVGEFFQRDDIGAVFCARGGFGSVQILSYLDPGTIARHRKIFVGYSDVTVLLNWLLQRCGVATFHGPMVAMDLARGLGERSADFFWQTLLGEMRGWEVSGNWVVRPGRAEAELMGGCLSILVTTLGTPYEIETAGKILFIEDVGEKPYRIERVLTHLRMAGKLDALAGLVFGSFTECEAESERGLKEIVEEHFHNAPYPVIAGFPAGHGEENLLLPFGVKMTLDAERGTLSLVESPVS